MTELDPTVHRLKELVAKTPRKFSAKERDVIQRAIQFGASEAQMEWLENILEKVEPEGERRVQRRRGDWEELAGCGACQGSGMAVLRKTMDPARKSGLFDYTAVPENQQFVECAFYCTCERGKALKSWQYGRLDALQAHAMGWEFPSA